DHETGRISNGIADLIIRFCRGHNDPFVPRIDHEFLERLIVDLRRVLYGFGNYGRRRPVIRKSAGFPTLLRQTEPEREPDEFEFEHQLKWLANLVWAYATERPIWEAALDKANRRSSELRRSHREEVQARARRLATLGDSPSPRS